MPQVPIPPDRVRDPFEKKVPGIGVGRDGARTPMQWDPGDFAGFSTVEPWLPISRNFRTENVENELREPSSIVLIALNLGSELISTPLPPDFGSGRVLVSSFGDLDGEPLTGRLELRGDEGLVIGLIESDADLRLCA